MLAGCLNTAEAVRRGFFRRWAQIQEPIEPASVETSLLHFLPHTANFFVGAPEWRFRLRLTLIHTCDLFAEHRTM